MTQIPSRDWNPFLTAGRALGSLKRSAAQSAASKGAQDLRSYQSTLSTQRARQAGGVLTVHFDGAQAAAAKSRGHKVEVGMPYPLKPEPFKGGTVRRNPQTQRVEANPEYQAAKSRVEHFNEVVSLNVGNPHIIPKYKKPMSSVFGE